MDNGSQTDLQIRRMPNGGYVVMDGWTSDPGRFRDLLFAATDVDVALKFIRDKIVPIPPTNPAGNAYKIETKT